MNISEAARLSGLSSKQIRDYEKNGLLPPAERSDSGYRQYTAEELETLRFIRHARDVGFSLKQIERLLQLQRNPQRSRREVKRITAEHIQELARKSVNCNVWRIPCSAGTIVATAVSRRIARF